MWLVSFCCFPSFSADDVVVEAATLVAAGVTDLAVVAATHASDFFVPLPGFAAVVDADLDPPAAAKAVIVTQTADKPSGKARPDQGNPVRSVVSFHRRSTILP